MVVCGCGAWDFSRLLPDPSMPPSKSAQSAAPEATGAEPTYEEAYAELEALVREMESDELPLGDLIEAYEKGIRLHALCQKRLEEAQGRIEIIRRRANGEVDLEDFAPSAAAEASSPSPSPSPTSLRNNAELF